MKTWHWILVVVLAFLLGWLASFLFPQDCPPCDGEVTADTTVVTDTLPGEVVVDSAGLTLLTDSIGVLLLVLEKVPEPFDCLGLPPGAECVVGHHFPNTP